VTASRVEAVLDVDASQVLTDSQKARVRARHGPRVVAIAQDERSQTRNRELALRRLRDRIERALHVPKHRRPTKPTKGSKVRRLDSKRRQGERKRDRRRPDVGE
jgi:ribosome-associated protein